MKSTENHKPIATWNTIFPQIDSQASSSVVILRPGQMLGFRGHLVSGIISQIIGSLRATIVGMCQSIRGSGAIFRQPYFAYRNWFSRGQVHRRISYQVTLSAKKTPAEPFCVISFHNSFFIELSRVESATEFGIKASWHRHLWNIHQFECIASLFARSSSGPGPLVLNNGKSIKILKMYSMQRDSRNATSELIWCYFPEKGSNWKMLNI